MVLYSSRADVLKWCIIEGEMNEVAEYATSSSQKSCWTSLLWRLPKSLLGVSALAASHAFRVTIYQRMKSSATRPPKQSWRYELELQTAKQNYVQVINMFEL